jgi:hypothetical protein
MGFNWLRPIRVYAELVNKADRGERLGTCLPVCLRRPGPTYSTMPRLGPRQKHGPDGSRFIRIQDGDNKYENAYTNPIGRDTMSLLILRFAFGDVGSCARGGDVVLLPK